MQSFSQDLRYGARMLAKNPVFTIIAVITLALGIGANTAIFSVVNAVLLRALPYHKAEQLVALLTVSSTGEQDLMSVPEAYDFRERMKSVEDVIVLQSQSVNLTGTDRPDRVRGAFVTANFFKFFNLTPSVGRTFVDGEDQPGTARVAVVNEKLWRERLIWLFGLAPALQLVRPQWQSFLKEGSKGSGESARWNRVRGGFVVFQVALSLWLLVSAGLLIRSFDRLLHVNVGFNPEQLLSLEYRLPHNKYTNSEAQWNFHRRVTEEIQQIPGVSSVSLVRGLPFSGNGGTLPIILPDRELPPQGSEPEVMFNAVMPNYFETIGIPLIKGRTFNNEDRSDTPVVFIINQTMAQRFWPGQDPLGKQIKLVQEGSTGTVIAVVGDAKHFLIEEEQRPQLYGAYSQDPGYFATVVIRTKVDPMSLSEQVRQAIWRVDPDQPMWKIRTVEFLVNRSVADRKFLIALMGIFAVLALMLTMIGLYGVISYLVNQRTQEIGIRMALGAQISQILRMILKQGLLLVFLGVGVGLVASWPLTRLMTSLLYQTSATDPVIFGGIALLLIVIALIACYVPARCATKVDPMVALRYE